MSNRPFKVVSERELGALSPEQRTIWKRLTARRKRLEAAQDRLNEDASLFMDSALLDIPVDNHAAATSVIFRDDGKIVQTFCECYKCQARLQGLAPSYVVEEMIRLRRIPSDRVPEARLWAANVEKRIGIPLLN